jgi:hypothetical protein
MPVPVGVTVTVGTGVTVTVGDGVTVGVNVTVAVGTTVPVGTTDVVGTGVVDKLMVREGAMPGIAVRAMVAVIVAKLTGDAVTIAVGTVAVGTTAVSGTGVSVPQMGPKTPPATRMTIRITTPVTVMPASRAISAKNQEGMPKIVRDIGVPPACNWGLCCRTRRSTATWCAGLG